MAFSAPDIAQAPITLAAGPDKIVVTGCTKAVAALTMEPSPLTIISGAVIASSSRMACTAVIKAWIKGIMRAFKLAVRARLGAPRLVANSWPQVTGIPVSSLTNACKRNSWVGLRTPNWAETENADTLSLLARIAALAASSSNASRACPLALCPPDKRIICSSSKISRKPLLVTCVSLKPASRAHIGAPLPSTTALVVRVVERETNSIWPIYWLGILRKDSPIPMVRSCRVVKLFTANRT